MKSKAGPYGSKKQKQKTPEFFRFCFFSRISDHVVVKEEKLIHAASRVENFRSFLVGDKIQNTKLDEFRVLYFVFCRVTKQDQTTKL